MTHEGFARFPLNALLGRLHRENGDAGLVDLEAVMTELLYYLLRLPSRRELALFLEGTGEAIAQAALPE